MYLYCPGRGLSPNGNRYRSPMSDFVKGDKGQQLYHRMDSNIAIAIGLAIRGRGRRRIKQHTFCALYTRIIYAVAAHVINNFQISSVGLLCGVRGGFKAERRAIIETSTPLREAHLHGTSHSTLPRAACWWVLGLQALVLTRFLKDKKAAY